MSQTLHQDYHKWVGFYIYFCRKYGFPATTPTALGPFLIKLAAKGNPIEQRHHAASLLARPDLKDPSLYIQLSSFSLSDPQPGAISPLASPAKISSAPWP